MVTTNKFRMFNKRKHVKKVKRSQNNNFYSVKPAKSNANPVYDPQSAKNRIISNEPSSNKSPKIAKIKNELSQRFFKKRKNIMKRITLFYKDHDKNWDTRDYREYVYSYVDKNGSPRKINLSKGIAYRSVEDLEYTKIEIASSWYLTAQPKKGHIEKLKVGKSEIKHEVRERTLEYIQEHCVPKKTIPQRMMPCDDSLVDSIPVGMIYFGMDSYEFPYKGHYAFDGNGRAKLVSEVVKNSLSLIIIFTHVRCWGDSVIDTLNHHIRRMRNLKKKITVLEVSVDENETDWVEHIRRRGNYWWYVDFNGRLKWYFIYKYKPPEHLPFMIAVDKHGLKSSNSILTDIECFGFNAIYKWIKTDTKLQISLNANGAGSLKEDELREFMTSLEEWKRPQSSWKPVMEDKIDFCPVTLN